MPKNLHEYQHITPIVADAVRRMFDPMYTATEVFKNKSIAKTFFELLVAIELIAILQKKQSAPTSEFLNFFKKSKQRDDKDGREVLADFVTLLYLDKEAKLLRAVIDHPHIQHLSAHEIINITSKVIDDERKYKGTRQESDSVKIKGGSKRAKIVRFEQSVNKNDGSNYIREKKEIPKDAFYRNLNSFWKKEDLRGDISKYLNQVYRSDRARNIHKVLEYYFDHPNEVITAKEMSRDLKISQKSLSHILSALRSDNRLLQVLKTLLL